MNAAQKLMLKQNVASHGARADYGYRHLGIPTARVSEAERLLANILIEHFFVDAIWVPVWRPLEQMRGTVLEIVGSTQNLELASYVHAFLTDTAQRLFKKHQRDTGLRSNKDRKKFLAGVMLGFQEKLKAQAVENKKEGLVWIKDGNLEEFYRRRHPRVSQRDVPHVALLRCVRPWSRRRSQHRAPQACFQRSRRWWASADEVNRVLDLRCACGWPAAREWHLLPRGRRARTARGSPPPRDPTRPRSWPAPSGRRSLPA